MITANTAQSPSVAGEPDGDVAAAKPPLSPTKVTKRCPGERLPLFLYLSFFAAFLSQITRVFDRV